jgi:uncharacterized protein (TIGR01440 family)
MIQQQLEQALRELLKQKPLTEKQLCVFGVSTSEVSGYQIGTKGNQDIAQSIFQAIRKVQREYGFHLAFQCCEHLNRACVMERATAEFFHYAEVAAIPTPQAGGSMAAYAFHHLTHAVLVETIQADAGIDIGDTLIGMHVKPVVVPFRSTVKKIGEANLNLAYSRPKYIGGPRTIYQLGERGRSRC